MDAVRSKCLKLETLPIATGRDLSVLWNFQGISGGLLQKL